jgi:branched-chain amino acid transport system substrate-binding protein
LAAIPLAEEHKTPLISCGASPMIVYNKNTGKPYKWVFKTPPSINLAVESIYANLKEKGINKIAILNDTTTFGRNGYRELDRLASHYGLQIVTKESYDPNDTDMTAMLMKIKASAPEAIINWSLGSAQSLVLRQWYELSTTKIPFYQSPAFADREIIELAGMAAEGVLSPQNAWAIPKLLPPNNPQKKVIANYWESYITRYGEQISYEGNYAWDATKLVVDAIKEVGPHRGEIRDYIENKKGFVGQSGIFNFSVDNHNGLTKRAFYMTVLRDGQWALGE